MEQNDAIDNLLEEYFHEKKEDLAIQKIIKIRTLQKVAKTEPIESNTFYRFIADCIKKTRIELNEIASIVNIDPTEISYIVNEPKPEPLWLSAISMANILLSFNLKIENMRKLIINTFKITKIPASSQKTMARTSNQVEDNKRNRLFQDGINAILFQVSINPSGKEKNEELITADDQKRIDAYVDKVKTELAKLDAEYLIS
jgi:hypothetical protein